MRGEDTEKNKKNRSRGRIVSDTVEEKKQKRRRKERQDERWVQRRGAKRDALINKLVMMKMKRISSQISKKESST